ncbi:MAG: DinB family protein [Bosea sp. (in: a-proteobacteria)]|jgi:uncharacterized damage-inducible protein DinB
MIAQDHVRLMARYNAWQNVSLYREADALGEAARRQERGAFFSSIHGTLSHLIWADKAWLHRFDGTGKPVGGIRESAGLYSDWLVMREDRVRLDAAICDWADRVDENWLSLATTWYSGSQGKDVTRANWLQVTHFFNHQTHHRGQIHAMITAAGGKPDETDIVFMPNVEAF